LIELSDNKVTPIMFLMSVSVEIRPPGEKATGTVNLAQSTRSRDSGYSPRVGLARRSQRMRGRSATILLPARVAHPIAESVPIPVATGAS